MDQTETSTTAADPSVAVSGAELYDQIMGQIEPELVSANVPRLSEKYTDESDEDRARRFDRYTKAYAEYDKQYAVWQESHNAEVGKHRRDALRSAEQRSKEEEATTLMQLEQEMESALPSAS